MQCLIDACARDDFPARVDIVISNKADAQGLQHAQEAGIETLAVPNQDYGSKKDFEDSLLKALQGRGVDLVCLAGFMRVLSPHFINAWQGRLINIHPSLLPDYKGLDTHARALADGKSEAGCTVHHVSAEVDSGAIILQRSVPIYGDDTVDQLAARVLEQEHILYPEAVQRLALEILEQ